MSLRESVRALFAELRGHGLFLVPVGALESWLPTLMNGVGHEDKNRWAMLAAEKIEDIGERQGDIWELIRAVYDFFKDSEGNSQEILLPCTLCYMKS